MEELMTLATKGRDLWLTIGGIAGLGLATWRLWLKGREDKREQDRHDAAREQEEEARRLKRRQGFEQCLRDLLTEKMPEGARRIRRESKIRELAARAAIGEENLVVKREQVQQAINVLTLVVNEEEDRQDRLPADKEASKEICKGIIANAKRQKEALEYALKNMDREL